MPKCIKTLQRLKNGLEMHQNTFLTTPDVEKYLFKGLDSGGLEMHQNRFLTAPEIKKTFFFLT